MRLRTIHCYPPPSTQRNLTGGLRFGRRCAYGSVPTAPRAASVRVWHITSRGWDPWTERPLPEGVRVAYPPDAVHNHFLLSTDSSSVRPLRDDYLRVVFDQGFWRTLDWLEPVLVEDLPRSQNVGASAWVEEQSYRDLADATEPFKNHLICERASVSSSLRRHEEAQPELRPGALARGMRLS